MNRHEIINNLSKNWDVIVIGGGITGAGVFHEASRIGLTTILVEQNDFAWGTSSRSGKLIHGGMRYLRQGQIRTTMQCVKERERLLVEYGDLIESLRFMFPAYKKDITPYLLKLGIKIYDLMAGRKDYRKYSADEIKMYLPSISSNNLKGGVSFTDAKTDDAKLVLRVIAGGKKFGGTALNYFQVIELLKNHLGQIIGVLVKDKLTGKEIELYAQVVINSTGIYADDIRSKIDKKPILRRLRGSHLIFPHWRFPVYQAISFNHPSDKRPLYLIPWEGVTLFGTTDLEHQTALENEPKISSSEGEYLLNALEAYFPELHLSKNDVLSTFSGIRPVINTGKSNPSKESRDYIILDDKGLITVTGGKLTTYRLLAQDTLKMAKKYLKSIGNKSNMIDNKNSDYEKEYFQIADSDSDILLKGFIDNTTISWADLVKEARFGQVVHLEDLLLRRTRLGLITPNGGIHLMNTMEKYLTEELGYSKEWFAEEKENYLKLWSEAYSPKLL